MREYVAMGSYGKRWGRLLEAMASLGEGYGKQCGKLWAAKASHRGGAMGSYGELPQPPPQQPQLPPPQPQPHTATTRTVSASSAMGSYGASSGELQGKLWGAMGSDGASYWKLRRAAQQIQQSQPQAQPRVNYLWLNTKG